MSIDEAPRRRGERLQELTRTGPDSDMGRLLRRFWHPVEVARLLAPGSARPLRVLSEDLTLYRSETGVPYLVGGRCAHRCTVLHTGWVEGEQIRCMYHGWRYDGTGQCTQRPAERDAGMPNVRIAGYPVREYGGLLFAYLGPDPPPSFDLVRKDAFAREGGFLYARKQVWDCNFLQMVENSMDAAHVSFVHAHGERGNFIESVTQAIPDLEYEETEAGIRQIATRGKGNIRVSDWTFPNANHVVVPGLEPQDSWIDLGGWNTPIDDEHTVRMFILSTPPQSPEVEARLRAFYAEHGDYNPADEREALLGSTAYRPDLKINLTSAQDYIAQRGQGTIADRTRETLGRSDAGIALLRRIYQREIDLLRSGAPSKEWRKLAHAVDLPIPAAR
jgi:5,5'-dehydrodivanillate O-demethylase oxygenase subunit